MTLKTHTRITTIIVLYVRIVLLATKAIC